MKKTLLFSAAILLSVASFAQTTVKNQGTLKNSSAVQSQKGGSEVKSSGSASSSTSIQSDAVKSTEHKTYSAAEKGKTEIAAEKKEIAAKAKTAEEKGKKTAAQDVTVSAGTQSDAKIDANENNNKTQGNANLSTEATVSSAAIKNSGNQMKQEAKNSVSAGTDLAVKNTNQVKTKANNTVIKSGEKINAASATTIKSGSSAAHSIKPGSAALKMNTHVKTNTGIIIK